MAAAKPVPVLDYLWDPSKIKIPGFCVIFGEDQFQKSEAAKTLRAGILKDEDAKFSLTRFEGKSARFEDVLRDLSTASLFGAGRRFIQVDDADPFVSQYRTELEDYTNRPSGKAVLLLLLKTFPSNTKLYKLLLESGLVLEAKPLEDKQVPHWLARWSRHRHGFQCDPDAAEMILQRVGPDHGMLDQELAKLALLVPPGETATVALVDKTVGSWWVQSVFQVLDLALAGKTGAALRLIDQLMISGKEAMDILPPISRTLRIYAHATEKILELEKQQKRVNLRTILSELGIWTSKLDESEKQLRLLGRHRGSRLSGWLLRADLDLKGGSKLNKRYVLETLIVRLSDARLRDAR